MQKRIIKRLLKEQKIDALLINSSHNRLWYTTFASTAGYLLITKTKSYLILDGRYIEAGTKQAKNVDNIILMNNINDQINELIKNNDIKTLGFESEATSHALFLHWTESFGTQLKPILMSNVRMIKSAVEIKKIKKAAKIGDKVFATILKKIKPKMTEKALERIIINSMLKYGADDASFNSIVASGERSSLPHGRASDKIINQNEIITCDFGVMYQGFCSDMTRTFVLGEILSKQLEEIYNIVLTAQTLAIQAIKPNIVASSLDKICRDYITNKGYGQYFSHSTGHGLGIEVHEAPYINATSDVVLCPGMVITIEPGIYLPKLGGVRIEDDILVTSDGYEILTNAPKKLIFVK